MSRTISIDARDRGISEIVHFTHQRALLGICFTKALLPRSELSQEQLLEYIVKLNAEFRSDHDWFGYVNLSIGDINRRFFRSAQRWHPDLWWVILAFSPELLDEDSVVFGTTNNSYKSTVKHGRGSAGWNALFEHVRHGGRWVTHAPSSSLAPACPQAEVLFEGRLTTDYLNTVYVRDEDNYREASSFLAFLDLNVPVKIAPERFTPHPTDLCERS